MYFPSSQLCGAPSSASPMPAAAIAAEDAYVAKVGDIFVSGDKAMADLVAALARGSGAGANRPPAALGTPAVPPGTPVGTIPRSTTGPARSPIFGSYPVPAAQRAVAQFVPGCGPVQTSLAAEAKSAAGVGKAVWGGLAILVLGCLAFSGGRR